MVFCLTTYSDTTSVSNISFIHIDDRLICIYYKEIKMLPLALNHTFLCLRPLGFDISNHEFC